VTATPEHLLLAPVVVPLLAAAMMLLLGERRRRLASTVNVAATGLVLVAAFVILRRVDAGGVPGRIGVYLASNWEAPFGIVLVADRLSALMLVLAGVVGLAAAVYAAAGWSRAGVYFHPLFQIQILGLNGAFLTGDLFNLFVFFEVALAASYGLLLHGSGWARVRSGLHYIAVNLLASALFLIGLALLYGVMGTLSMADVAVKLPSVPASDRALLHAGAAILAVAFLTKAAILPLNSWLVPAYLAASAPVGALFALMTKLGIYAILRTSTLAFSAHAGPSAHFGEPIFLYGGLATGAVGTLGLLASVRLGRVAAFSVIVSSGTLLAAIGTGVPSVTSAALFYLLGATLGASLFFLLVELIEREGVGRHRAGLREAEVEPGEDTNLDDAEEALVGRVIPTSQAALGLAFIACAVLVAGLPPLSTFVAKATLLASLASAVGRGSSSASGAAIWCVFGLVLGSGLVATLSLTRTGIKSFWSPGAGSAPRLRLAESVPVVALILACAWLTVRAEPVLRYTSATAEALYAPTAYIDAVLSTRPVPGPARPTVGSRATP
jgi:multicomponent K+:H+ antiporter subunit D